MQGKTNRSYQYVCLPSLVLLSGFKRLRELAVSTTL